jgi:hypothetical protein
VLCNSRRKSSGVDRFCFRCRQAVESISERNQKSRSGRKRIEAGCGEVGEFANIGDVVMLWF